MIVGFWNVQRATNPNPNSEKAGWRAGFFQYQLSEWLLNRAPGPRPDVLFLAEVSQSGPQLAAVMAVQHANYRFQYVPVQGPAGGVSICSFMVVWRNHLGPLAPVQPIGNNVRRPAVRLRTNNRDLVGVHIIANRDKSLEESLTFCTDLTASSNPVLLIGDMNYPAEKLTAADRQPFNALGFRYVSPNMQGKTFWGEATLDYAWCEPGINNATGRPPYPSYSEWDAIDHAPVAYKI